MAKHKKKYIDGTYIGTTKFSWSVPEYQQYTRDKKWYAIAGIIALLLLIYSVFSANFLFGIIIIIAAVTIFYMDHNKPEDIEFMITSKGIVIGDKFYEYVELVNFYIIYEPPEIKNLFFEFRNIIKPRINIPLGDHNPVELRKLLKKYLEEDLEKQGEPISETLGKFFKL